MSDFFSPREFMKMRRPEEFSDTILVSEGKLNSSFLEYKLDSITNNNQERDFENFCVKLAQYELLPNLRVQTGPVGGGDSKADSETYPVSPQLSLNHWEGIVNENNERWAIAISAKKDWVSKVKSDVINIQSTNRDYKRIFFISNQFAPDKKRAQLEDKLSQDSKISVTILDRSWIIDRLFFNHREKLAIEELHLGEGLEEKTEVGPLDFKRGKKFEELNISIEELINSGPFGFDLIRKTLRAALLGKNMDLSKSAVDGLFDRAIRVAEKYGTIEQVFDAKYQKAWASFFWHEDFEQFMVLYADLEKIAKETTNIYTAERLNGIFGLLSVLNRQHPEYKIIIEERAKIVLEILTSFSQDEHRPNAMLQAKSMLVLNRLMSNPGNEENVGKCFIELTSILDESERKIGFPYENTKTIIEEFGEEFGSNTEYERLLNRLVEVDTKRKGELPAAISLFKYGIQHLNGNRIYKSIDYIGRSLVGLYKEESKEDFIYALYLISIAYEKAGLLWASRGTLINAASYATADFWKYNNINTLQARSYSKLKNIELKLGRVGYVLEWHQLDMMISYSLYKEASEVLQLEKDIAHFGQLLGLVLIKTKPNELHQVKRLPDVLMNLNLDFAAYGLLYLLNGLKFLPKEFLDEKLVSNPNEFFSKWLDQPAQADLPSEPLFYNDASVQLSSSILGMEVLVETVNDSPGIEIAESLLATMESFLSTLIQIHAVARVETFFITIVKNEILADIVTYKTDDDRNNRLIVEYRNFSPHQLSKEEQNIIGDLIFEIIKYLLINTIAIQDWIYR